MLHTLVLDDDGVLYSIDDMYNYPSLIAMYLRFCGISSSCVPTVAYTRGRTNVDISNRLNSPGIYLPIVL